MSMTLVIKCSSLILKRYSSVNYSKFHRKIEIQAIDGWDIFKILHFLSYMPETFSSPGVELTRIEDFSYKISIFEKKI